MKIKKPKDFSVKSIKIDVESRFSESDLEYVTEDDSYQMLQSFDSWHEYKHDKENYAI